LEHFVKKIDPILSAIFEENSLENEKIAPQSVSHVTLVALSQG
jgi:hypothetical protein